MKSDLPLSILHVNAYKQGKIQVINANYKHVKFCKSLTEARKFIKEYTKEREFEMSAI